MTDRQNRDLHQREAVSVHQPIIEFSHFTFQYRTQTEPTVQDICLSIYPGEKILIAGPSGCGKSTLVNCMNGLIPFTYRGQIEGSLKIRGRESRKQSLVELSGTVGTVLQDSDAQFIGLTVREDIAFVLENENVPTQEMKERVQKTAQIVDVEALLRQAPGNLSGGQKQRVSVAGILVDDVDVMLFDEPLANLDPATGKTAMELIDQVSKQTGAAVVLVEHRLEDVLHIPIDRIVLMDEGRIRFDGPADELLSTALLQQIGIREPLYLTALKYAGIPVTPELKPSRIETLQLSEAMKQQVRDWYHSCPKQKPENAQRDLLTIRNLEFAYDPDHPILKGVDLTLHKGELTALVGKNGAGKSTLSKVICGFERPSAGELLLDGTDLLSLSIKECADRIGYVMQNPNKMISKAMIFDEVALGLRMRGMAEEAIREKVEKTLQICGLYPFRNWPVSALSYGQKKRMTIASILVLEPEVLILDEPTAGQDLRHYTEIMEFLKQLHAEGLTILMITHDMHLMLEYAQRSIVFCDGQILADQTSAKVLTDPETIRKAYLKETSLYWLALSCGIEDPSDFVQHFIDADREGRKA